MKYWYYKVSPELTAYLQSVLVSEKGAAKVCPELPMVTNGQSALLCRICATGCQLTLFRQSVPKKQWQPEKDTTLIAFFFKPFVLGTIFNLSAKDFNKTPKALEHWDARQAMAIKLQMPHAQSTLKKVGILEEFILAQVRAQQKYCDLILNATDRLLEDPTVNALSRLLKEQNLSERTFQRIFKKYVGIAPNHYRRICQFQMAFMQLKSGKFDKQTDVAYSSAYFDQSHFIRSFKEFTGTTPREYLQKGLAQK